MSAILVKWRMGGAFGVYTHVGLLLSRTKVKNFPGLKSSQTKDDDMVYISLYEPKEGTRFTSQLLSQDVNNGKPVSYVVLPTVEDGNTWGLSEFAMAKHWEEVYGMKKTSHEAVVEAATKAALVFEKKESKSAEKLGQEPEDLTEKKEMNAEGNLKALAALSSDFKLFTHEKLNCWEMTGRIIEKGGAKLFVDRKPKELFFEEYFHRLEQAISGVIAKDGAKKIVHPVVIKENSNVAGELAEARAMQMSFFRI